MEVMIPNKVARFYGPRCITCVCAPIFHNWLGRVTLALCGVV